MESEEWPEAELMMKAQSDKNPDGFDHSGIIEAPERRFLKLPFYEQSLCVLQKFWLRTLDLHRGLSRHKLIAQTVSCEKV
jgi:hypothetical protein